MIEAHALRRVYGDEVAVEDVTFTVRPGLVTGFPGPNGSGTSTTMRMILGLDRPTSGSVLVNGLAFERHADPMRALGALVDTRAVHPGRSALNHLRALAATGGIGERRVREVVETVGLAEVVRQRAGGFSLGMLQRLGTGCALLGDPSTVMLDEPTDGPDPDGILRLRTMLKQLAAQGRAVPAVWRVVLGHVTVLTGIALLGLGVAAVTRSTVAAIFTVLGLLFVVPAALTPLPGTFPGRGVLVTFAPRERPAWTP